MSYIYFQAILGYRVTAVLKKNIKEAKWKKIGEGDKKMLYEFLFFKIKIIGLKNTTAFNVQRM